MDKKVLNCYLLKIFIYSKFGHDLKIVSNSILIKKLRALLKFWQICKSSTNIYVMN